jgi:hypothetical protein
MLVKFGDKEFNFNPGDAIDLGEEGLIEWFEGKRATANRLFREAHQETNQRIIDFVEKRVRNETVKYENALRKISVGLVLPEDDENALFPSEVIELIDKTLGYIP